jgi:hypothetical protein
MLVDPGAGAIGVLCAIQAPPSGVGHLMHLLLWPQSGLDHTWDASRGVPLPRKGRLDCAYSRTS